MVIYPFVYFRMLDTAALPLHDLQYGPQAAFSRRAFLDHCATADHRLATSWHRSLGAVVGAAFLFRRWWQHRQVLREAQARGDRVEVIARLRTVTTPQAEAHRTNDSAHFQAS